MAKKKTEINEDLDINDLYAVLSNGVGGELLEDRDKSAWGFIDTGVLGLNFILSGKFIGGGVQGGTCIEVSGGNSSGKSLLGSNVLRGCQTAQGISIFLDAERTISKSFAVSASKVDPKKLIVIEPPTLESSFNRIHKCIRMVRKEAKVPLEKPIVIVYDSIAISPSEREFAEVELDLETASKSEIKAAGAGTDKPGERAKICSRELRKMPPILAENNVVLFIINQLRNSIGTLWGDPLVSAGGGKALEFATSVRVKLSSSKQIKDNLGRVIGININVKCIKNKCFRPFTELHSLRLLFDCGIDPFGGLLELMLQEERIEAIKPAGNYKIKEPWAAGQDITFKSSKERNDIPADVLLKCPTLVDATDSSQIQYYIDMFSLALNAVKGDLIEEDVENEE